MSAVILPFNRSARADAEKSRDALLRTCRLSARTLGCNSAQIAAVEHGAKLDLAAGFLTAHQVVQRAKSLASTLAHPRPDPDGPRAA